MAFHSSSAYVFFSLSNCGHDLQFFRNFLHRRILWKIVNRFNRDLLILHMFLFC